MSDVTMATRNYRAARDTLLDLRECHLDAAAAFHWPELGERFNWAVDWFDAIAEGNDRPALVIVEQDGTRTSRSFAELSARSDQVARWLAGQGVARGDGVLLMLGNQLDLWESMLAVMKLGAVIMPTTPALGPADLLDRVERGGARHVIVAAHDASKFDQVPGDYTRIAVGDPVAGWLDFADSHRAATGALEHPGTAPGDRLLLYFTSGTTSKPKLVEHTQASYPVGHLSTMYWLGLRPGDVHLNISSSGWAKHAWSCVFAPWNAGATVLVHNVSRFAAPALLDVLVRCRVSTFCAPPTVWRMLVQEDLTRWPVPARELVGAGEPLNPEVIEQVRKAWGTTVRDGYGQTETTAMIGNPPGQPVRPGSMGRPLPGYAVTLLDPVTGAPAEEGEICLDLARRPAGLMTGYRDDPGLTAEVSRAGHYHTGDVAARSTDGYVTYVGRADDVFKASDYRISPFELESVLIEHEAVAEAAVVPAPDPVRLAVPKAYVLLAAGHEPTRDTALAILRHCRQQLAPFRRVRRIEFAELPKTVSGKIRRVELRTAEEQRASTPDTRGAREFWEEDFPELRG